MDVILDDYAVFLGDCQLVPQYKSPAWYLFFKGRSLIDIDNLLCVYLYAF